MARDEQGNIIFDAEEQAKVDAIIQERVARVKAEKPADYDDYKAIGEELQAFGYKGTPSEIRAEIKRQRESTQAQIELAELEQQADDEGITPALAKKIKDLEDKLEKSTKALDEITGERQAKVKQAEEQKAQEEFYNQQRQALLEKHNVDAEDLEKNPRFMKFVKGKKITDLVEVYEDFAEFIGETEADTIAKAKSKEERSTSGGKGTNTDGAVYGLSPNQQTLAKKSGMSYKEYAELLKNIQ